MGLDMYLNKAKRIDNATIHQIAAIDKYYSWLERGEEYKYYSMERYCGTDISEVDMNLAAKYKSEYIRRYSYWDTDKEYGYNAIFQNIAYWRKANQIHSWFVKNVQSNEDDCGSYDVTKEQLEKLLDVCEKVKASSELVDGMVINGYTLSGPCYKSGKVIKNPEVAIELLPTQSGFFFGNTDYNEWYLEDIEDTIKLLKRILKETDFDNWIVFYHSSW